MRGILLGLAGGAALFTITLPMSPLARAVGPACPTNPADVNRWVGDLLGGAIDPSDYGPRRSWFTSCSTQITSGSSAVSRGNGYVQALVDQCTSPFGGFSESLQLETGGPPGNSLGLVGIGTSGVTGPSSPERVYTNPRRVIHNVPGVQDVAAPLKDPAFLNVVGNPTIPATDPRFRAAVDRMIASMRTATNPADPSIPAVDPNRPIRVFQYTSQHLKSVGTPSGYGRIFIQIPGPYYDQWIQLSSDTGTPPGGPTTSTVPGNAFSVVTLMHHDRNNGSPTPLDPPEIYFNDLWRNHNSSGQLTGIDHRLDHQGMENCIQCHKTGLNAIYPRPGTPVTLLSHEDAQGRPVPGPSAGPEVTDPTTVINHLNRDVTRFGSTVVAPGFAGQGQNWGPSLGSETPTDAFIRQCANLPAGSPDIARLRSKMNCAVCHDGGMANPINYPSGTNDAGPPPIPSVPGQPASQDMAHSAIINGRMPQGGTPLPGPPSTLRQSLFNCLRDQYYAGFSNVTSSAGPGTLLRSLRPDACRQLSLVQQLGNGSFCLNASGAGMPTVPVPTGTTQPPLCSASAVTTLGTPPPPSVIGGGGGGTPLSGVPTSPH